MLSFQHSEFFYGLFLLFVPGLLFYRALHKKKEARQLMGEGRLVNLLTQQYSPRMYAVKFGILTLALALAIVTATNLRKPMPNPNERRAGIDVMIALDVSKSMWSQDAKPTRLDKAKQFVAGLITQLAGNRSGLVIFAGRAYLQMPLTPDVAAAGIFVANASPDAVPVQGTVIGDALELCNNSLDTKEKKYKAVVLVTDGEDHDPNSTKALQELNDEGVVVQTIGVGSPDGSPIIEPGTNTYKRDVDGNVVISKLNEKELQLIAKRTGGEYHHLDDVDETIAEVTQTLNGMEKKMIETGSGGKGYASFYLLFLLPAFLLLVAEIFIPERKIQWHENNLLLRFLRGVYSLRGTAGQWLRRKGE